MSKIFLQVPFSQKDEARSLGAKWDTKEKSWYVTGDTIPKQLQKWNKHIVVVSNEDKDFLKSTLPSLKWNPNIFNWECSEEDYIKYTGDTQ